MSRRIEDMHPALQPKVRQFLFECERDGLDVLITCTHRTDAEQEELYAQGRTKPGKIVTRARAGQSKHNNMLNGKPASLAFDFVPLRNGKLVWGASGDGIDDNPADDLKDDLELWQRIAQVAKRQGFQWFGDKGSPFPELPHLQQVPA